MRCFLLLAPVMTGLIISSCAPLPPKHEVTYTINCEATTRFHHRYDYFHVPPQVDTQGTAAREVSPGQFLVGYENSWEESGIGGVNHRYLGFAYRGFIFCDKQALPKKGLVISAALHFQVLSTENWMGASAGTTANTSYSASEGVNITLTTTMNRIVNGYDPNHGFMLIGTDESYSHNNNRFLSYYSTPLLTLTVLEDKPQWPSP